MKISAKHRLIILFLCLFSAINSEETLALVGLPEIEPHENKDDGHFNGRIKKNPVLWDVRDLKIGNEIYTNVLKENYGALIEESILRTLRIWEHAANITFERCIDCPDDKIINIGAGHTPRMSTKDDGTPYEKEPVGKWETDGRTFDYAWGNSSYFTDGYTWLSATLLGLALSDTFIDVLAHEVGHALGLSHLNDEDFDRFEGQATNNIMNEAVYVPNKLGHVRQASVWDIQHLQSLYGSSLLEPDIKTFYLDGSVGYQNIGEGPGDNRPSNYSFYGDGGNESELVNHKPDTPPYQLWKYINSGGYLFSPAKDPDGNRLTYSIIKNPIHGQATISGNKLNYVPELDYSGGDRFEYRAADPYGLSANGVVNISVIPYKELMVVNKNGNGTITSEPEGINCGPVCTAEFPRGSYISLRNTPAQGAVFRQWGANCNGAGSCEVTMNAFKTITADFGPAPTSFALTVDKNGNGSGRVSAPSIDCGTECIHDYNIYANLTLKATPDNGSIFRGWSGACSGKDACTIWMYNDKNVTATFSSGSVSSIVVTNLNDSGPGSLRQAILEANEHVGDDIIVFQSGISGTITLTSGQLEITEAVTIDGPGAKVVAISGNNASRIFRIDPAGLNEIVALNGLTLTASQDVTGNGGGAMIIDSGSVTISNCVFSNNAADIGGGGGAIRKLSSGSLTISHSTVSGNSAFDEFRQGEGGGIRNEQGSLTISNSTVSGNTSANGGGIAMDDGKLTILNSTLADNSATNSGGGIFNTSGAFEQPGEFFLGNSIVSGNTAPTDKELQNIGTFTSKGYNLFGENGASGVTKDTLLAKSDLILAGKRSSAIGPLADNGGQTQTHKPVAGSPVVDAGDNTLIPQMSTTDQRGIGFPRILNGTVDIGALENIIMYALSVNQSGGSGTIISNPAGINCGTTCVHAFKENSMVTLTTNANSGSIFIGWDGACDGKENCQLTLHQAQTVTAKFSEATTQLSVDKIGSGGGKVTSNPAGIDCGNACTHEFDKNSQVKLTATADSGATFSGWGGACSGTDVCLVTLNGATNVSANFADIQMPDAKIECLLNWAENYSDLFAPSGSPTAFWSVYIYRYYATTDAYVGVSSTDNHAYYLGTDKILQDVGPVSYWLPIASCQ